MGKKEKRICKICCRHVKIGKGLQCCGTCECWYHFKCLCYDSKKIKMIKSGKERIECPCPDCSVVPPSVLKSPQSASLLRQMSHVENPCKMLMEMYAPPHQQNFQQQPYSPEDCQVQMHPDVPVSAAPSTQQYCPPPQPQQYYSPPQQPTHQHQHYPYPTQAQPSAPVTIANQPPMIPSQQLSPPVTYASCPPELLIKLACPPSCPCSPCSPCMKECCKECKKLRKKLKKKSLKPPKQKKKKLRDKTGACIPEHPIPAVTSCCKHLTVCNSVDRISGFKSLSESKIDCANKKQEIMDRCVNKETDTKLDQSKSLMKLVCKQVVSRGTDPAPCEPGPRKLTYDTGQRAFTTLTSDETECVQTQPSSFTDQEQLYRNEEQRLLSLGTVEKMCTTVGKLTYQINDLMDKLKHTITYPDTTNMSEIRPDRFDTTQRHRRLAEKHKKPAIRHCI